MVKADFIIGIFGNIISIISFASPMTSIYIFTLLSTSLWTFYGILDIGEGLLISTVNGVGVASQIIYIFIFLFYASKARKRTVIKTRSVKYMPYLLSLTLLINSVVWFTFALLVMDFFVLVPNAIGVVMGSLQQTVHLIYKNKTPSSNSTVETIADEVIVESTKVQDVEGGNQLKMQNEKSCSKT